MKNIDIVIDTLAERVKELEFQINLKDYRIKQLERELESLRGKSDDEV